MSVASEITRIQTAKADIKASIEAKGVTIPSDALIDEYADYVDQIQTGGGGGQAEEDLKNLIERDLRSINIPNGTTNIGQYAFYFCSYLTSVTIPNSVTSISRYAFYGCSGLTSVTIGSGVTSIGSSAFQNCSGLTSVTIPNSVTSISGSAFNKCTGLTNITIPSNVTTIDSFAFDACSSLASVTVEATTPPKLGGSAFRNNASGRKIYVPAASVETYKAASGWTKYASDIEAIPAE